jgi:hypothetical protein
MAVRDHGDQERNAELRLTYDLGIVVSPDVVDDRIGSGELINIDVHYELFSHKNLSFFALQGCFCSSFRPLRLNRKNILTRLLYYLRRDFYKDFARMLQFCAIFVVFPILLCVLSIVFTLFVDEKGEMLQWEGKFFIGRGSRVYIGCFWSQCCQRTRFEGQIVSSGSPGEFI